MKKTGIHDCEGNPIHYGELLDFIWWDNWQYEVELHYKAKIRHRKSGDIFEFVENHYGKPCHFTHRLSALNWCEADLLIIKNEKEYEQRPQNA